MEDFSLQVLKFLMALEKLGATDLPELGSLTRAKKILAGRELLTHEDVTKLAVKFKFPEKGFGLNATTCNTIN